VKAGRNANGHKPAVFGAPLRLVAVLRLVEVLRLQLRQTAGLLPLCASVVAPGHLLSQALCVVHDRSSHVALRSGTAAVPQ